MKKDKIWMILGAVTAILLVACVTLSAVTLVRQDKLQQLMMQQMGDSEDVLREDDVPICGEYTILSTKAISDAYRSGKTEGLSDMDKETLDMAKAVLDEIITDDMSDYEKEKAVYEWLVGEMKSSTAALTVIPGNGDESDTPHGVLKYRNAVCVGYATTFRMFMQMMGIECKVVHNTTLSHSWDLVQLDGEWYHVDCYSDADASMYANFNMNDSQCAEGHDWNREFFPAANGSTYNYVMMNSEELADIYAVPQWLMKASEEGKSIACATFRSEITPELVPAAKYMAETLAERMSNYEFDYYVSSEWQQNAEGQYVLVFHLPQESTGEESAELDPEIAAKVDAAINKVLGEAVYDDAYYGDDYSEYAKG